MLAAAVLAWMGVLCVCDVRQRRLPNWLTLPGAGVILLFAGLAGRGVPALAGAAALAGVYLLVHLALPAAMGAGDVKLAIGLGGLTGCFGVEVWFLAALADPGLLAQTANGKTLGNNRSSTSSTDDQHIAMPDRRSHTRYESAA